MAATMLTTAAAARPVLITRQGAGSRKPASHAARATHLVVQAQQDVDNAATPQAPAAVAVPETPAQQNGAGSAVEMLPERELEYVEPSGGDKLWTSLRLISALPWRRFKKGSALVLKLGGAIAEQPQGRFSSTVSLPALCDCLKKAALDPRVAGVVIKIEPLACGWAKLQEVRRHIEYFRSSGKFCMAYMERAGEKEYYLASACGEIYAPPSASVSIRGMSVAGTFLRGALEKVGIEPEVRRIGKYKSAGDQLLREDMSEPQREQLTALLDDIYDGFVADVAASLGKSQEEVIAFMDRGEYDMEAVKAAGFVTGLVYECELEEMLKKRTGGKEDQLPTVGYSKYKKVRPSTFGINAGGKKAVAVVRTSGAIIGGSGGTGATITAADVIRQLRGIKKNKAIAAVVLRIDSPGGDALASDLMWREIQELAKTKPVIASMADVAASGGYYMAMACSKIVAESRTITGSIGVVTGKFNLAELYTKLGYSKEVLSKGKWAQLLSEAKPFSEEEAALFDASAMHAYESFRNKAAASRGMTVEATQEVAQGRVWSGRRAATIGLVDSLGGVSRAIQLAKLAAGLKLDERVRVLEVSRAKTSPLQLITGGGGASLSATLGMLLLQSVFNGGSPSQGAMATGAAAGAPLLMQALSAAMAGSAAGAEALPAAGAVRAEMPDIVVEGVASQALLAAGCAPSSSPLFDDA
ncbi:hypothetical protein D9Q98_000839 [Chlorella vulgaris]|uniref:Peptidase S49 domain-containing protein n=1 Tax=Chlorella vulgaris TaxID=3077 RepID=A0A9D4TZ12_CHLVU|nr:hypothetical protein D9Q98_000839 [Chlorella vulgaris]